MKIPFAPSFEDLEGPPPLKYKINLKFKDDEIIVIPNEFEQRYSKVSEISLDNDSEMTRLTYGNEEGFAI